MENTDTIAAALSSLDRTALWGLLRLLDPRTFADFAAPDPETGEEFDGPAADECAAAIVAALVGTLEDVRPGSGMSLVELAAIDQAQRTARTLESVAQERVDDVPAWLAEVTW